MFLLIPLVYARRVPALCRGTLVFSRRAALGVLLFMVAHLVPVSLSVAQDALSDSRVPLLWNDRQQAYLSPDGQRPTEINPATHRILAPYPNVVWDAERKTYQTLEGSPLPLVNDPATKRKGIPVEAIDPYLGLRERVRGKSPSKGKIPVFFDRQLQAYSDGDGRKIESWNDATHEVVRPAPNVVWNSDRGQYTTRDGSPLPWLKDRRGWEGIPVEAFDPSPGDPRRYLPVQQEIAPEGRVKRIPRQLELLDKLNVFEHGLQKAQQQGGRSVPSSLLDVVSRMRRGVEGNVLREAPEALRKWSEQSQTESAKSQNVVPSTRSHISQRPGFGNNRINANSAAQDRQSRAAPTSGSGGPQFNGKSVNELVGIMNEAPSLLQQEGFQRSSRMDDWQQRLFAKAGQVIQEMQRYNAGWMDAQNWERSRRMNEESLRLLHALKKADTADVQRAVDAIMDLLPASIGEPAKAYLKKTDALYRQEPQAIDPVTGLLAIPNGNSDDPINVRAGAGITDVDTGLALATGDFFADLIHRNPDLAPEIAHQVARIDAANEWVHQWSRAQDEVVENWIQNQEKIWSRFIAAGGDPLNGLKTIPGVPLRLGGTLFPDAPAVGSTPGISTTFGTWENYFLVQREHRQLQRLTRYGWQDSHRLSRLIPLHSADLGMLFATPPR